MDKKYLLKTAKKLKQVSNKTSEEYTCKTDQLIVEMNNRMLQRTDLENLVGKNNIKMMQDNHANHVRFIASVLCNNNPEVLVETVLWVFRAYRSHGFSTNYWAAQLNNWLAVFKDSLTAETYNEIIPLYNWMLINIPTFVKISSQELENKSNIP